MRGKDKRYGKIKNINGGNYNMNKRVFAILTAILVTTVICASLLTGCGPTSVIDDFRKEISKADSGRILVVMKSSVYDEEVRMVTYIDSNKTFTPAYSDEPDEYTELVGTTLNVYTNDGYGNWEKESYTYDKTEGLADEEILSLLNGDNYEYSSEEKVFKKKTDVTLEYDGIVFETLSLTIVDGVCQMTGKVKYEGISMECGVEISDLNKVELSFDQTVKVIVDGKKLSY